MTVRALLWMGSSALALTAGLSLAPSTAQAACVLAGSTVTCDGTDDDGFTGGNSLTLNALTGSFVQSVYDGNPSTFCPAFRAAIRLGSNARISNTGQILGRGNCGLGIDTGNGLVLTNDGTISTDSEVAFAVLTGSNFDITNRGTIRTVNATSAGMIGVSSGRMVNAMGALISTTGSDGIGIYVDDNNTITNAGTIRTSGTGGTGIDAGSNNSITNTGAITTTGIAAPGIRVRGTNNVIVNSGSISTLPALAPRDGENSVGITIEDGRNALTNSGTINGDYAGVVMNGLANRLTNSGTITSRAPVSATTLGGAVVLENSSGVIINSGTIRGVGSVAIRVRDGAALQLTNTGLIDGDIVMNSAGASAVGLGTGGVVTGTIFGGANSSIGLSGNGALSNPIVNVGSLTQSTDGAWTLGRRYNFNTSVLVNSPGATLTLTDGVAVNTLVQVRGRLAGVGTIASTSGGFTPQVVVDGALTPGLTATPGARLAVNMRLTLTALAKAEFDVSGSANDRIDVTDRINSAGQLSVTYSGPPVRNGQSFTLMTANAIQTLAGQSCAGTVQQGAALGTGCFTLTDNAPYFVTSSAVITNTSVTLNVQRTAFASVGQTVEEAGLGAAFDRAVAAGSDPMGLVARLDGMTAAQAQSTFATLTSDSPVAAQTWTVLAGQTAADALAPWLDLSSTPHTRGTWRTWGSVLARAGESGPKTDAGNFDYEMKGLSAGADYAVDDDTRIGFRASHIDGETYFDVGRARNDLSTTLFGLYATHQNEAWFANIGGLMGDGSLTTSRLNGYVDPLALVVGNLSAHADTDLRSAFGEAGYIILSGAWQIKPTVGLNYTHAKIDAFAENVATGLAVQTQKETSARGEIGVRANTAEEMPVRISVAAFWSQDLKDNDRTASARLVGFTDSNFTIVGRAEKRGWLKTQAAASMDLTPALTAKLAWTGILNDRLGGHAATAGLSYRW